jgi:hypothetical protein
MLLSARLLVNLTDANTWEPSDNIRFTEGDTPYVYFQLIDLNKDRSSQGFKPAGKRFMPASGATLSVSVNSIDTARTLTKVATQPYAGDASIWKFQLLTSDNLKGGTFSLILTLTEGIVVTSGRVINALSVEPINSAFI